MRRFASTFSLVLALSVVALTGCGGKKDAQVQGEKQPAGESRQVSKTNNVPSTSPEMNAARSRLVGVWTGQMQVNPSKVAETLRARSKDINDAQIRAAIDTLQSLRMQIDFGPNGRMNLNASLQEQQQTTEATGAGRWELLQANNNNVLIRSIEEGKEPEEVQIHFENDTEFSMQPPKEYAGIGMMRFRKLR